MTAPLIGITTGRFTLRTGAVVMGATDTYVNSLARAGAHPVLIPLGLPEDSLTALVQRLDGVLFTGGGDVHPQRYGSQMTPAVNSIDEDRDRVEIHLLHAALKRRLPFLGICRGLQLINVSLGGSLYEDIQEQHRGSIKHDYFMTDGWKRDHKAHEVRLESGSLIADIMATQELAVNSLHHQGVRRLAAGLKMTAHAPDGILEAFEMADYPFGLAVQWHPEALPEDPLQRRLFQEFVHAAENRSEQRTDWHL